MVCGMELSNFHKKAILKVPIPSIFMFQWIYFIVYIIVNIFWRIVYIEY